MPKFNQLYAACSYDLWTQKTVTLEKRLGKDWTKQRKDSRAAAAAALEISSSSSISASSSSSNVSSGSSALSENRVRSVGSVLMHFLYSKKVISDKFK